MAGRPSLIVALVSLTEEVSAFWLSPLHLNRLIDEITQKVAAALNASPDQELSSLMQGRVDAIYIKPTTALVALGSLLKKCGVRSAITVGDSSASDEEDAMKWMSDNNCEEDLEFVNVEAELLEVGAGKNPNIWVSRTMPLQKKDSWLVLELTSFHEVGLHTLLTESWEKPGGGRESLDSSETTSTVPAAPVIVPKTSFELQQAFVSSLIHYRLLIPSIPPADLYEADELLAYLLKATYRMFATAAKKLVNLLPSLAPGKAPNTTPLEILLEETQFPMTEGRWGAWEGEEKRLGNEVDGLKRSYDRVLAALTLGLEGLEAAQTSFVDRKANVVFETQVDESGTSFFLVNKSDIPAHSLNVRFISLNGSVLQRFEGLSVPAKNSLICLQAAYLQQWKDSGLTKIELEGSEERIEIAY